MRLLTALLALSPSVALQNGERVIHDAYARYGGDWFRSVTFVQKTTFGDGRVETWYESLQLPGKLRIDYAPSASGRTIIFRNDSLYAYQAGSRGAPRPLQHALLILLYDLHVDPPDVTIGKLQSLGFDMTRSSRSTWQGSPVIVVGADTGDTTSRQIWFDAERLLPVRVIQPSAQGAQDIRIGGYVAVGRWWHEREVTFRVNGVVTLTEEYTDVTIDAPLPASVFDPVAKLIRPAWIGEGLPRW